MLKPDAIVLLTENPEIIASQRRKRDGIEVAVESTEYFQREERLYADEVARDINVKIFICEGAKGLIQAIDFIKFHVPDLCDYNLCMRPKLSAIHAQNYIVSIWAIRKNRTRTIDKALYKVVKCG